MDTATGVQIVDEADRISRNAIILGEGINPTLLSLSTNG